MVLNHDIYPAFPFPTLDRLGIPNSSTPTSLGTLTIDKARSVAQGWLQDFSLAMHNQDVYRIMGLLHDGRGDVPAWWRDMLSFTWDFRTFRGEVKIKAFLQARLGFTRPSEFVLDDASISVDRPYEDILWISLSFTFKTKVGSGSGIIRLIPTPISSADTSSSVDSVQLKWRAFTVYTNLEALHNFPEKIGPNRSFASNHGDWESQRLHALEFKDKNPEVLIIGGGHCGLAVAARLKALGVCSLIVEKNEEIGDNWRNRYEGLCLHDPVWFDHMPYLPFPPTWPVFTPALKFANWLKFYADAMELSVWTSSSVTSLGQNAQSLEWTVTVVRKTAAADNGDEIEERILRVKHVVFATGFGGVTPNTPMYPGMDTFKGQILHSTQHKKASDHTGKKVVVVGSCTSAHDIATEYYSHNIDVTLFQRSSSSTYIMSCDKAWPIVFKGTYWEGGLPTERCDRLTASWGYHAFTELGARRVRSIAQGVDRDLLDGLKQVGFKTNLGIKDTGFSLLARTKAGGYYLDTGASQLIIDGKIKLKATSDIQAFTESGITFEDGTHLDADVVIFATGLGDPKENIDVLVGPNVAPRVKPLWGLNEEGELRGAWREVGLPGLWCMLGNLAFARFHSMHVALQIKAMLEGLFLTGERYSAE
ncbi:hypothetical protein CVT24_010175 [Panaeolus cyanescens]|uniref:FAD/NAD(P)-binding domain-containing protein n=1 Tax=Panaeolus cyanescens TaxID=181874 RepID=A0A409W9L7_9AGAR|nr:hypothetical protein CVT24_010175 [Panaeolus cyanescens]